MIKNYSAIDLFLVVGIGAGIESMTGVKCDRPLLIVEKAHGVVEAYILILYFLNKYLN